MLGELNRNLRYLFILNLAFGFSIQLITPLFPLFLSEMGASAYENAFVISVGSLASTVLMIPSGLLIDRIGGKLLLLGSAVVNMVSILLFSYTSTWQEVVPLFILFNASWALFIPARMAMITANSDLARRGSVFGVMNTAWPLSGVVSTLLSGFLIESMGWGWVFMVGAAVNALSLFAGFRIQRRGDSRPHPGGGGVKELLGVEVLPVLVTFFIYGALITTAIGGLNMVIPLYLESRFFLTESRIALFFTAQSIITLVTQMPSGALADRYGRRRVIIVLVTFLPFLFASWHFIDDWRIMLALNSLAYGLWAMTWPAVLSLLSSCVPDRMAGAAFGVNMTGNRLGATIGPIVASFFYVNYSRTAPFIGAGFITVLALFVAYLMKEPLDG